MGMTVSTSVAEYINFAAVSCGFKFMGPVTVKDGCGKNVILKISSVPQFMFEYKSAHTLQSDSVELEAPELLLDTEYFAQNYNLAGKGEIKVEILDAEDTEKILAFQHLSIHIQPYLHWDVVKYAQTMPAFMQPGDDLVAEVLNQAGTYAESYGIKMYGYQGKSQDSVILLTKAIYQALCDQEIHYIMNSPSYELAGQEIIIPGRLLREKSNQGTCLDLAVLFASCLERVGLNSLIIVIPGHAFVGVWLDENAGFETGYFEDVSAVKAMKSKLGGALLPVECTTFTAGGAASFEAAVDIGNKNMDDCRYVLDVAASRREGIVPVFASVPQTNVNKEDSEESAHKEKKAKRNPEKCIPEIEIEVVDSKTDEFDEDIKEELIKEELIEEELVEEELIEEENADEDSVLPEKRQEEVIEESEAEKTDTEHAQDTKQSEDSSERKYDKKFYEVAKENDTKLHRLQKQAMDTSVRNHLIAKKTDIPKLEFGIHTAEFLCTEYKEDVFFEYAKEQILRAKVKEEKLEQMLRRMWSADRQVYKEQGKHTLYLALNELVWKKEDDDKHYQAVLYLCPVEIVKNKRGEYWFKANKEEMFFNPVLKELLYQDYEINIYDMDDCPLENYEEQMEALRYAIAKKTEWSVVEDKACISTYTIPNEAIWRALKNPDILQNEIISSILDGAMHWDNKMDTTSQAADEHEVYVFPSDSSQSDVIRLATQRKTQVVIGPAGNGKTQTISNILSDEMKRGKNVLFVSEKISALEVVKSMLEKAGVERFCLYLPDGVKAAKSVKEQIDATMRFMEQYEKVDKSIEDLERGYRTAGRKIADFHQVMKEQDSCGKSLQELIELYEKYREIPSLLSWKSAKKAMNHEDAEDLIEEYIHTLKVCGKENPKFKKYFRQDELSPEEERNTRILVDEALKKMEILRRNIEMLEKEIGIPFDNLDKKQEVVKFAGLASHIRNCPVLGEDVSMLIRNTEEKLSKGKETAFDMLVQIEQSNPKSRKYKIESDVLDEYIQSNYSFEFYKAWIRKRDIAAKKELLTNAGAEDMKLFKNEEQKVKLQQYTKVKRNLNNIMSGLSKEQKDAFELVIDRVACGEGEHYRILADDISMAKHDFWDAQDQAVELALCNLADFEKNYPRVMKIDLLKEWKDNEKHLKNMKIFQAIFQEAEEIGIQSILRQIDELVEEGKLEIDQIKDAFRKCRCEYNIEKIMSKKDTIITDHMKYRNALRKYSGQEAKIRMQLRDNLVDIQMDRLPNMAEGTVDNPEWGRLNKSIRRKGKVMGVRKVFEDSPNILAQMYPCMLMTPGAVAEYIPDNFPVFDMVIIDEGSQMPTYKALIPISKGKRCLIFGDEMQLTPTKFFQKRFEEDGYMAPIESILEDAIITGMPKKMLRYHYRSENENLMAFSNHTYYNGEVVTFPSCNTKVTGIEYNYLENGCYDRGGTTTNAVEAEFVVERIQKIYENLPEDTSETVGVITLNIAQRNLIQSKLLSCNQQREFGRKVDELVQVVNLEACQGKEWDHVILSFGYGPDKEGRFTNSFGPLALEDGGNRLNVMVTRARKNMYVVTSMQPEMISLEASGGVKDLKNFLLFARGDLRFDKRTVGVSQSKNGIYKAIVKALTDYGYEVHTDVGSSKCKIDVAVVSKEDPNTYQLGIILDNFDKVRYNVKDKEIICPTYLKKKGWQIYRLHSINWYRDAEYELRTILGMLN